MSDKTVDDLTTDETTRTEAKNLVTSSGLSPQLAVVAATAKKYGLNDAVDLTVEGIRAMRTTTKQKGSKEEIDKLTAKLAEATKNKDFARTVGLKRRIADLRKAG